MTKQTCTCCYAATVPPARAALGYHTCLSCGEKAASKVRHCSAPINKSNYYYVSDLDVLKQTNPKRTT